jgi:hypothetical protein
VLQGKEWRGWYKNESLPAPAQRPVGVLAASSTDSKTWSCTFRPSAAGFASACDFYAALLGFELTSQVKAGENRGRKLEHDFVVLKLAKAAAEQDGETYRVTLDCGSGAGESKRLGIAVWITLRNQLEALQALGGWIPSTSSRAE